MVESQEIVIRVLTQADYAAAVELLAADELRTEDILRVGSMFWGAFHANQMVGVIGCEIENDCGLLRSAVVEKRYRGLGIGNRLTQCLLSAAREKGLRAIYLFSTDAGSYWLRQGFQPSTVAEIVASLPNSPQVRLFDRLGWLPTEDAYIYPL